MCTSSLIIFYINNVYIRILKFNFIIKNNQNCQMISLFIKCPLNPICYSFLESQFVDADNLIFNIHLNNIPKHAFVRLPSRSRILFLP